MIEGAIIGAVIGLVMTLVLAAKQKKRKQTILQALHTEGPAAARAELDRAIPALTKIPMGKLVEQIERMATLGIIGDTTALKREIAEHTGKLTCVAQTNAIALLGLTIRDDDKAAAAEQLVALADRVEKEGGATLKLVKKKVRAFANLGQGAAGTEILSPEVVKEARIMATKEAPMVRVIVLQALVLAAEAAGGDAAELRAKVREHTTAFED